MQAARLTIPPARLVIIIVLASGAQFIASGVGSSSDHSSNDHPSSAVDQAVKPGISGDLADWRSEATQRALPRGQSGFESGFHYDEQSSCWETPAPWTQPDNRVALGNRPGAGARPMVY